ncbi:hypothetical protein MH215_24600, partial [Paenibacillus sp. ACRSA]|uniref:hypothetical protein n=1 Tax=Paenibacillus sp. ACRSA TaxID=2918211 RepID=UPI001EF45CE2
PKPQTPKLKTKNTLNQKSKRPEGRLLIIPIPYPTKRWGFYLKISSLVQQRSGGDEIDSGEAERSPLSP